MRFPAPMDRTRVDDGASEQGDHRSIESRKDSIVGVVMFAAFLVASFAIYIAVFCPSVFGEVNASLAMLVR